MKQGFIHVYMGDGKGKTTAAVGQCVRAAGAGLRVVFVQFMKGRKTSELNSLQRLENLKILRSEEDFGFYAQMSEGDRTEITRIHNRLIDEVTTLVNEGSCDLVVLDELTYPYEWNLIRRESVEELICHKPEQLELVITGRNPAPIMLEQADYITEMKMIRHPYEQGITAREGIEF